VKQTVYETPYDWRKGWDNGREHHRFNIPELYTRSLEETADEHTVFVSGLAAISCQTPAIAQDTAVKEAAYYVGISDINSKEHRRAPLHTEWRRDRDSNPGGGISHPLA
jgi:hypothetical protein